MYADLCYAGASSADSDYAAGSVIGSSDDVPAVSAEERNKHMIAMFLSFARQIAFGMVRDWLSDLEVYLTPDPLGARSRAKIPDLIECQGLDIKVNHLFRIQCAIFSVITKCSWLASSENFCPIDRLATNRHIPSNKSENIEECGPSLMGNSDPVLNSACPPNTRPIKNVLCSFHFYSPHQIPLP